MTMRSVARAALVGFGCVTVFACYLRWGEYRALTFVLAPCIMAVIAVVGWMLAAAGDVPRPVFLGGVLPFLIVCLAPVVGLLILQPLQINPVLGADGWIGWIVVALAAYPVAAAWTHPSPRRRRIVAAGTLMVMFAAMVGYSWSARERWRYTYYAGRIGQDVVSVFEIPGFNVAGMRPVSDPHSPLSGMRLRYLLVGDGGGPFSGHTLRVDATLGPQTVVSQGVTPPVGLRPLACGGAADAVEPGRWICAAYVELWIDGARFLVAGFEPARALDIALTAKVKQWSTSDLRYIPLLSPGRP